MTAIAPMSPRAPEPVGVPKVAATQFERELRRELIDPTMERVRQVLSSLVGQEGLSPQDFSRRLADEIQRATAALDIIANDAAVGHVARVATWHRKRLLATFRAVGLDLSPLMSEAAVRTALAIRIGDNVNLIRTIPQRMHAGLTKRMQTLVGTHRFDPGMLERVLRAEYKSTGWNLRRLARDQTTKEIGQLTQIRHTQAGFLRYYWVSAGDKRVRPTHAANDGQVFAWTDPPATGHPGTEILCRCQAAAVVEDVDIQLAASIFQ